MRARSTTASPGLRPRLAAAGCAGLTMVAAVLLTACAGSAPRATLPKLSPGASAPGQPPPSHTPAPRTPSPSASPGRSESSRATPGSSASPSVSPAKAARTAPARTHSPSPFPTVAPATGGGGTAGFQHAWLLGLGAVAILTGVGCVGGVAYRRLRTGVR
jgi:hypothetical protein